MHCNKLEGPRGCPFPIGTCSGGFGDPRWRNRDKVREDVP